METEKEIKEHFISYQQTEQTIPYRKTLPHIRFVDTIGLVCPFLHQCDFSDLAIRQIEEYDHCLWEEVFPPHAYDLASHKPLGVFDWARGWGWYVLGLIETADLPGNKKRILNLSNHLRLFRKQMEDSVVWYSILTNDLNLRAAPVWIVVRSCVPSVW